LIIGLTGGIGAGKSTVARMLAERGAVIIDTDAIAREVVQAPSRVLDTIREEFGDSVIRPDGTLDRAALGRIVFHDETKRKKLNALTHPAILKRVLSLIGQQPADAIVVVVVPLLFESNFEKNCQAVIAVIASPAVRRSRLMARDDLSASEIEARMRSQIDEKEYEKRGARLLRNDGSTADLQSAVAELWNRLLSE